MPKYLPKLFFRNVSADHRAAEMIEAPKLNPKNRVRGSARAAPTDSDQAEQREREREREEGKKALNLKNGLHRRRRRRDGRR